jgi:hypothetical protein
MTVYAKTWCPADPCDPCLLTWGSTVNSNGSDPILAYADTDYCPVDQSASLVPVNRSYLQVSNMLEESGATGYSGVRKWGLPLNTVPGSSPLRFCLPVSGTMANGVPLPLGNLTVSYGVSGVVLSVSGVIKGITSGPATIQPDGTSIAAFNGYIEVPDDGHIIYAQTLHFYPWEWTWFGPVILPQQVTLQWSLVVKDIWQCHYPVPPPFNYHYQLASTYGPSSGSLESVNYYRTGIQEMPSSLKRSELGHRLPLVARFQGY